MKNHPVYKKAIFNSARRAMLENEYILRPFVEQYVPEHYTIEEVEKLNFLMEGILDNDLFDVVMGKKQAEEFGDLYDVRFLKDIEEFAKTYRTRFTPKKDG